MAKFEHTGGARLASLSWLPCVLLVGIFCSGPGFAVDGELPVGYGTKNKAMGGAGMALPEEAAAVINNPATALAVAGQMQAGLSVFHPRARYSTTQSSNNGENGAFTIGPNTLDSKSSYRYLPYFATSARAKENAAVAVALYTRAGLNLDYRGGTATFNADGQGATTRPGTYGDGDARWSTYQIMLDMAYAWQLNDKLSFGITGVLASQSFSVRGIGTLAPFTETYASSGGSVMPRHLSGNGSDWTYGGGAKVGLHAQLTPAISVGVMYQSKIYMSKVSDYSDLLPGRGKFDMPADLKIGISWKALDNLALSLDAERIFYGGVGAFSNPVQNLLGCPTANPGGMDAASCLGGKNGASLGWESITVYKIGGRWGISDRLTLRAGIALTDQPIKNPQTSNNLLTPYLAETHYALGFSWAVSDHAELNFSTYYTEEESQIWPNFFDPSQDVKIESDQFDFELSYSFKF